LKQAIQVTEKTTIMKKLIFVLTLTGIISNLNAQVNPGEIQKPMTDIKQGQHYKQKSKNQKTTAWILLTGGAAVSLGGMIIQAGTETLGILVYMTGTKPEYNQTGNYVAYAGLATMATSIPFFIASGENKKRANIALQQQKISMGNKTSQQLNYHSISLSISLGK
jgi:hypothetical protein